MTGDVRDEERRIEDPQPTRWPIGPDQLPIWLRWVFNGALAIVAAWSLTQIIYWLLFGAVNPGPFPEATRCAFLVVISAWGIAIVIRWGYSVWRGLHD